MSTSNDVFGLKGKVAVVLGGGLGMGESTSRLLAEAGCDVAVVDIDAGRAASVVEKLATAAGKCIPLAGDVRELEVLDRLVADTEERLGGLDVLVTIIGQAEFVHFLDMTPAQWDQDHDRNLRYFAFASQAAARSMMRRGKPGAITAISSVSGIQSAPHHAAYGAAKAGMINLTKSLAVELADYSIRVNSVAPGGILTDRQAEAPSAAETQAKVKKSLIPFKRFGESDDIGQAVRFLSSDLAKYISGQTLAVDGGWTSVWTLGPMLDSPKFASQFGVAPPTGT